MTPAGPFSAYSPMTPRPRICTRPTVRAGPGTYGPPASWATRTSVPAGRPTEPALRGPSSGLAVIMLAASVIP
jgi:hypothetical protein